MAGDNGRVFYYPGCSLDSSGRELGESFLEVARDLGLDMTPLEEWSCCGSSPAHSIRPGWALKLAARNLLLAEEQGAAELMVMCPSCFVRLRQADRAIREDEAKGREVEEAFGKRYRGTVRLRFFLEALDRSGVKALQERIQRPLGGLKGALYYGCLLGRPEWVTGFDVDPYESFLEELVTVLGAETVSWAYPKHCCGAHLGVTRPASAERLVARIHDFARRAGANCLVVFCPMCQMNLELRTGEGTPLPVLYISELIGLASGSPRVGRWMDKHLVDPRPLLRSLNIL